VWFDAFIALQELRGELVLGSPQLRRQEEYRNMVVLQLKE
jgi:hypothetical protein